MNITLYQAAEDVRAELEQIDPETGELPDGYESVRDIVVRKAANVAAYIADCAESASILKAHAKRYSDRAKTVERRAEWLRKYLAESMAKTGITRVVDERSMLAATLAIGRDEAVVIFDEKQLPSDYMREIPATCEPDKALIKKAIKEGFDVPGAKIEHRDRLTIK